MLSCMAPHESVSILRPKLLRTSYSHGMISVISALFLPSISVSAVCRSGRLKALSPNCGRIPKRKDVCLSPYKKKKLSISYCLITQSRLLSHLRYRKGEVQCFISHTRASLGYILRSIKSSHKIRGSCSGSLNVIFAFQTSIFRDEIAFDWHPRLHPWEIEIPKAY